MREREGGLDCVVLARNLYSYNDKALVVSPRNRKNLGYIEVYIHVT